MLWKSALRLGCVVAPGHPAQRGDREFPGGHGSPGRAAEQGADDPALSRGAVQLAVQGAAPLYRDQLTAVGQQLALGGDHVVFTSELDVAQELATGQLVFIPIRDRGAEPQEISVAVDATKPLGPIVKLVSGRLIAAMQDCLAAARGQGARTV